LNALSGLSATLRLTAPSRPPEAEAEELAAKHTGNRALALVDRQVQPSVKPPQKLHDPFARLAAANVNVAVVRIAHEAMAPAFQFLIHLIEQHIGQKRRQRPALRRAHHPLLDHAMVHDAAVQIGPDQADNPLV